MENSLRNKVGIIKVDFWIFKKGYNEVHEIKSKITKTPLYRLKKKIFKINYPDIIFKEII